MRDIKTLLFICKDYHPFWAVCKTAPAMECAANAALRLRAITEEEHKRLNAHLRKMARDLWKKHGEEYDPIYFAETLLGVTRNGKNWDESREFCEAYIGEPTTEQLELL